MKLKSNPAMQSAIAAVEMIYHPMPKQLDLRNDPRLLALKQLHNLNKDSLRRAQLAEHAATVSRLTALRAYTETKVRVEILMEELGIELPGNDDELEGA